MAFALVIGGAGLWLILRRPQAGSPREIPTGGEIAAVDNGRRSPAARVPRAPRLAASDARPDQPDATAPAPRTEVEMLRQRQRLLASNYPKAMQEADERAFAKLAISDDKRAAIRALNQRVARVLEKALAARGDPSVPRQQTTTATTADIPNRRELIEGILGLATARAFRSFETAEIRRIQRRYIAQFDVDMDRQLLAPAGGPTPPR